jgi:GR25 family glycosyltransferase involved in LPS biosynthesis
MRVRLHASWCDDATIREMFNRSSPDGDYRWRDLELTLDDDYDRLVVFNYPTYEVDPARTIIFQSEARPSRQRIAYEFGDRMAGCRLVDTDSHFNFDKWYVDRSYAQLRAPIEKTRELSAVVSGVHLLPRHRQRLDFVLRRLPHAGALDHYGRGLPDAPTVRGEIADKAEALLPYRYTFNAENSLEPNYFTEKILDPILCECLCFYDGCPNLEAFLDPESFVRISLDRPDEALETIRDAIATGEWERRLPAIREQKRRLMEELNPLEIIRKAVSGESLLWRSDDELDAGEPMPRRSDLPPVYVVNLPEAAARAARVTKHLDRLGIEFSFLEGVRGDGLTPDEIARRVDVPTLVDRIGRPASGGELGCALSHEDALERLLRSGERCAIVLEDDARLADEAPEILARVAASVVPGDLVLIGAGGGTPLWFGRRRRVGLHTVVAPAARSDVRGTYGYLVTREAAAAIRRTYPRVRALADDWSLFGGVALLRILEPRLAWTWGPFIEPSEIAAARLDAVAEQSSEMRHSLMARLGYKARLIAAVYPRYGYRLIRVVDLFELASLALRRLRFRLRRA